MDENSITSELFESLIKNDHKDLIDHLNAFSKLFKYKLTSYCAIKNPEKCNEWSLFYGKVLFLPLFLKEKGENIENEFKKKYGNKSANSEQIIINIKFEKINNFEEINGIFINVLKENKIKNADNFYLYPDESSKPIFNFYPNSIIPYGDLYIKGEQNIRTDCKLEIGTLLKSTPFQDQIKLRKYLTLDGYFDFNYNYVELAEQSAIHIQFIPPVYFVIPDESDYNGCPIKFNFVNGIEENNFDINYEIYDFNGINKTLENGKIESNKIKIKKEPHGSFKVNIPLPDRIENRYIKFNLKYKDIEVHNYTKGYYKDIVRIIIDKVKINSLLPIFSWLRKYWKYILTILPILGLFEFIFYIIENGIQLPISLLNPELFITLPLLYAISVAIMYVLLFIIPLAIPLFIKNMRDIPQSKTNKAIFKKIEKYLIPIYSIVTIIIYLFFEYWIIYFFLRLFLKVKSIWVLIILCVLILIFIALSYFLLRKKLISPMRYISISSFIMFSILYIIFFLKFPGEPLRALKIGGGIPIKLCVSEKFIISTNLRFRNKYYNRNIPLCNVNDFKNTIKMAKNSKGINKSQWINFLLFFKTQNGYYVNCGKSTAIISIPNNYVYSEKIITTHKLKK